MALCLIVKETDIFNQMVAFQRLSNRHADANKPSLKNDTVYIEVDYVRK